MKKSIAIVLAIISLVVGAGGTFLAVYFYNQGIIEEYQEQVSILQTSLDSIGDISTAYTVNKQTVPGELITEEMLEPISIPASMLNESFVLDTTDIAGKFSKVALVPGTPITADVVMGEDINDKDALYHTVRSYDVVVNLWPIGLQIGDYVDMRIMMPRGEEYIVLSHMRVNGISDATVKFNMTEAQINLYQSALVDYYLNSSQGVIIYFTKYIEPGVQKPALITYKVSDDIMEAMKKNGNLYATAWASVYDATVRNAIDTDLVPTEKEENMDNDAITGMISGGRGTWVGSVQGGENTYTETAEAEEGDGSEW